MTDAPRDLVRPLLRVRQVRQFRTDAPVTGEELAALADVARWSGSSKNSQPWRFITITDPQLLRQLWQSSLPQTRSLETAAAAIAIVLPVEKGAAISHAYDEGRVAERILAAASLLDLGAGIAWVMADARPAVASLLGIPDGWSLRTIVSLGHASDAAARPKSAPGEARRPRDEMVCAERWEG